MSSDDGGLTWTKHKEYIVSQDLVPTPAGFGEKFDCRDPKVFIVEDKGIRHIGKNGIKYAENILELNKK